MLVVFKNIKQQNVLIFDAEYNEGDLIQFSGILFRRVEKDIYQICKSLNIYVQLENTHVNKFIISFTGIDDDYLNEHGVSLTEAKEIIKEFLNGVSDILFVSHGLYNDRVTMENNGIDFFHIDGAIVNGYCTYQAARRVLKREKKLSLTDIAIEAGIFLENKHNAFDDT